MDWFWIAILMTYMYLMGSFTTWYLTKKADDK